MLSKSNASCMSGIMSIFTSPPERKKTFKSKGRTIFFTLTQNHDEKRSV